MTNQEVFNRVWERAKDKRKAELPNGKCRYRTECGLACFVGALIPDEIYSTSMEEKSAWTLFQEHLSIVDLFDGVDQRLIEDLQEVHDDRCTEGWEAELIDLASVYNLTVPA